MFKSMLSSVLTSVVNRIFLFISTYPTPMSYIFYTFFIIAFKEFFFKFGYEVAVEFVQQNNQIKIE